MNGIDQFRADIWQKAKWLSEREHKVVLLHHNDTDGLTSGAILQKALRRERFDLHRYALEKPFPKVLQRLFDLHAVDSTFLLADFASGMLPTISKLNGGRHQILILDHHLIRPSGDPTIHLLNGLERGLKNVHFSSSTLCYEFALAMNEWNRDLAWLGALGALADGFFLDGKLAGMNAEAWDTACAAKAARDPYIYIADRERSYLEIKDALDSLGSIGYFNGGPDVAVKALSDGIEEGFWKTAERFQREKKEAFEKLKENIDLSSNGAVQWFSSAEFFLPFGVKTIGLFCEELLRTGAIHPERYLIGFQKLREEIPGLGSFIFGETKLSIRVPEKLDEKIRLGQMPSVTELLPPAVDAVGGFLDACHPTAGAATVPCGKEEKLIDLMVSKLPDGK